MATELGDLCVLITDLSQVPRIEGITFCKGLKRLQVTPPEYIVKQQPGEYPGMGIDWSQWNLNETSLQFEEPQPVIQQNNTVRTGSDSQPIIVFDLNLMRAGPGNRQPAIKQENAVRTVPNDQSLVYIDPSNLGPGPSKKVRYVRVINKQTGNPVNTIRGLPILNQIAQQQSAFNASINQGLPRISIKAEPPIPMLSKPMEDIHEAPMPSNGKPLPGVKVEVPMSNPKRSLSNIRISTPVPLSTNHVPVSVPAISFSNIKIPRPVPTNLIKDAKTAASVRVSTNPLDKVDVDTPITRPKQSNDEAGDSDVEILDEVPAKPKIALNVKISQELAQRFLPDVTVEGEVHVATEEPVVEVPQLEVPTQIKVHQFPIPKQTTFKLPTRITMPEVTIKKKKIPEPKPELELDPQPAPEVILPNDGEELILPDDMDDNDVTDLPKDIDDFEIPTYGGEIIPDDVETESQIDPLSDATDSQNYLPQMPDHEDSAIDTNDTVNQESHDEANDDEDTEEYEPTPSRPNQFHASYFTGNDLRYLNYTFRYRLRCAQPGQYTVKALAQKLRVRRQVIEDWFAAREMPRRVVPMDWLKFKRKKWRIRDVTVKISEDDITGEANETDVSKEEAAIKNDAINENEFEMEEKSARDDKIDESKVQKEKVDKEKEKAFFYEENDDFSNNT